MGLFTTTTATDPGDDLMTMQQSFRVVTIHFPAFVDDVKRVAVLRREADTVRAGETGVTEHTEESAQKLMSAARNVADAFTNMLESARPLTAGQTHEEMNIASDEHTKISQPAITSPVSSVSRKAIIEAASRVGEASNDLLRHVMRDTTEEEQEGYMLLLTEEERVYQDQLLGFAKAVANSTACLVVKAKNLATQPTLEPDAQQRVIAAATQTGLCTSQLVACTKVLAPTIHQPSCQQQLLEAAREVSWTVDGVVQASRAAALTTTEQPIHVQEPVHAAVTETETAATEVRDVLDQLNAHLLKASAKAYAGDALDNFQLAYENLQQCYTHDGQRMVASARRLAQATAQMIADIKVQGEQAGDDPDRQSRLFSAAKQLADTTTALIAAAKVCSGNPDNLLLQSELHEAAENLNAIAYSAAAELWQVRLIRSLQMAARASVTGATQLVNVSQVAAKRSRGNTYQVVTDAKSVSDLIPRTVISVRDSRSNPEDPMTQMELIEACERFIVPCESLVRSSRSIAPTVTDPTVQAALENATARLATDADVLRACLARLAPLSRHLQVEGAVARLARLIVEASAIESGMKQGTLFPLPDDKVDDCFNLLNTSVHDATILTKELQSLIDTLARQQPDVISHVDVCGPSASSLASSVGNLVKATRGIVAHEARTSSESSPAWPVTLATESARLEVTHDMRQTVQLAYELVKAASDAHVACDANQPLTLATVLSHSEQLMIQLLDALSRCLRGLPGHREISEATHLIERRREDLVQLTHAAPTRTVRWVEPALYEQTQSDLTRAAVEFNQVTGDLLSSYSPGAFRRTTKRFTGAYDQLTEKGVELSEVAPVLDENRSSSQQTINRDLLDGLVNVSDHSYTLINEARKVCARPQEHDLRDRFQLAARDVTESISQLLTICASGVTPDQRECELALRRLDAMRPLLENPSRSLNSNNYYDCVDAVAKSLSPLAESLRGMSNATRDRQIQEFSASVRQFANSICKLVEETAQATYLIGLADSRSEPSRPPIVNAPSFVRTQREIQRICDAICDPSIASRQLITLSTDLAHNAKILCEACGTVSSQTANPEARQQLNTLTRDTMQSITSLIQYRGNASRVDSGGEWTTEAARQRTLTNARTVSSQVNRLVHLVTQSPQFTAQVTRVADEAKEAQQPVCSAGLTSLSCAQTVLKAAHSLISNTRSGHSESALISFSNSSKDLSESIKTLAAAMREHAPGQRDCQRTLGNIAQLMQELQRAKMASMEGRLQPHRDLSEEGFQKQLATSVRALLDCAPMLGRAARFEAEQLAHAVQMLNSYLPGMVSSAVAAASRSALPSIQLVYLEHASAILEAADQLLTVARDAGGNPRAVHLHAGLDDAARGLMESCEDLLTALDDIASRQGHVSTLIDTLNRALAQTEDIVQVPMDARFSDYQTRLIRIARHMEQLNQVIQLRARQPLTEGELTPLAHSLTQEYQEMCQTCKGAAATLPEARKADELRVAVKSVGLAVAEVIQATATSRLRRTDAQHMLLSQNRGIADVDKRAESLDARLRELIALLDTHGPITQACLQSANTVSGIIADLDTTILFASSGTLHPPIHDDVDAIMHSDSSRSPYALTGAGEAIADLGMRFDSRGTDDYSMEGFQPVRESIVRAARALVDDTQSLVSGTGEDQTRLANTAHVAVERVAQLADVVKRGAAFIGPGQPDTQVELLSCCRDVAAGVRNVLQTVSQTPGRLQTDLMFEEVRTNAQLTFSNIRTLLQKVKSIEGDELRGIQALTLATKHCREQAMQLVDPGTLLTPSSSHKSTQSVANISAMSGSSSMVARYLAPDDLARAASGPLQNAVSKVILASSTRTQRDAFIAATTTRDVVTDLVTATKNLLRNVDGSNINAKALCASTSQALADEFALLLDSLKAVIQSDANTEGRDRIAVAARRIADLAHTLLNSLDKLRVGPRLLMYFRACSPEWRDVAEKFIGRHVAYHHHYVPNYETVPSKVAPHFYGARSDQHALHLRRIKQHQNEDDKSGEVEARMDSSIQQIESSLVDNLPEECLLILRSVHAAATASRNLIKTTTLIGLAPPSEAADRARRALTSQKEDTPSALLWRTELTVSLATQDMCHLAQLCSDAVKDYTSRSVDVFGTSCRLIPSKERLLAAARHVAATSAQLLMFVRTRKAPNAFSDMQKLQAAGQFVKETTDKLSVVLQSGQFSCDSSGLYVTGPLKPSLQSVIDTQTKIRSQQAELDVLEKQLAQLRAEQIQARPDLMGTD